VNASASSWRLVRRIGESNVLACCAGMLAAWRALLSWRGALLRSKLARGAWRPQARPGQARRHFRIRCERSLSPRPSEPLIGRNFGLGGTGICRWQRCRMSRIELQAFWPFPGRVDADADLLVQRKLGGRRMVGSRDAPARGNKRRKQEASYTPEILNQWHGRASQRRSAACNSRRHASLNSRKGSIPPKSFGKSANDMFGER
jgi:hypothetical protein